MQLLCSLIRTLTILRLAHQKTSISLRLLDWLCTNYSKKHTLIIQNESNNCNIYLSYKTQLKAFSKRQFDPFCRRFRITFTVHDKQGTEVSLETTLGQLNFFKWAISNQIIDYAYKNSMSIDADMNDSLAVRRVNTNSKPTKQRIPVKQRKNKSLIVAKTFTRHASKVLVSFD